MRCPHATLESPGSGLFLVSQGTNFPHLPTVMLQGRTTPPYTGETTANTLRSENTMILACCHQHHHHTWPDLAPVLLVGYLAGTRRHLKPWATGHLDLNLTLHFQRETMRPERSNDLSKVSQPVGGCSTPGILVSQ